MTEPHVTVPDSVPDISVIVPAYNEERRLPPTLIEMIDYFDHRGCEYEIIVVDDGSTDATREVVGKFGKLRSQVTLIALEKNYGKGFAVRTGMLRARGVNVLFADADGATPIVELERLEQALEDTTDVAIGSRAIVASDTSVKTSILRKFLGQSFNRCVNFLVLPGIVDTQCGFKLFRRHTAQFLFGLQRSSRFGFDVEILHIAQRADIGIAEVPINWTNIAGSKVNLVRDAIQMFFDILKFKVRHRSVTPESYSQFIAEGGTYKGE